MKKTKKIEYLKRDTEALKEELKTGDFAKERKSIHANLIIEQKHRVLEITEVFSPTKAEKSTRVSHKNIFRWKAAGINNLAIYIKYIKSIYFMCLYKIPYILYAFSLSAR